MCMGGDIMKLHDSDSKEREKGELGYIKDV